jgi:peptidoglycan/xylan/chitin deacetylase (PgdA/CDA1 family)
MVTYWAKTPRLLRELYPKGLVWDMPVSGEPTVYITFDDGPHPTATPFAMQQLAQYNAKATFFCVGNNVVRFPDIYEELLKNGHATANHTFNHMNGWKTEDDTYLRNIDKASEYIDSKLFRPPYGLIKRSQAKRLRQKYPDWKIIMWNVLSGDFDRALSPEKCLDNVLKHIKPGSIVLFHDSEKAWDRMNYALPKVLAHCHQQGWKMKALTF